MNDIISIKNGNVLDVSWDMVLLQSVSIHNTHVISKLHVKEIHEIEKLSTESRKKEFVAIRYLKNIKFKNKFIEYSAIGKPYLVNSPFHIGISHSKNIGIFAYSSLPFGCDIEEFHPRILKVQEKFCNKSELILIKEFPIVESLTTLWAGKEACYKLIEAKGIHWKDDLICQKFDSDFMSFKVKVKDKEIRIKCSVMKLENSALVIAIYE